MKQYILTLAFSCSSLNLAAQSKDQITNWVYDLPIDKSAIKIKKAIQKNECFAEDAKSLSANSKYSSSRYTGIILKPHLPKAGRLDSAKIELTTGILNSTDGYSGSMKWLRFEYFSSDTIYLKELFDSACNDLTNQSIQQKPAGFRKMKEVIGEGRKYIYINDTNELRSTSVLRVRYANGTQSFSIHSSGSGD